MNQQFADQVNFDHFLCEIDCDTPFNAFQDAFDDYRDRGKSGFLVVLCDAPSDQHHPAFIERCCFWADKELRETENGLLYRRSFPWAPSARLRRIDRGELHSFFGDERHDSLDGWLSARECGLSFYVSIRSSIWRPKFKDNLEELMQTIARGTKGGHDPDRPCVVFVGAQGEPSCDECLPAIKSAVGNAGADLKVLDDFSPVAPDDVYKWYDSIVRREIFADWIDHSHRSALIDHIFTENLEARPIRKVLEAIQQFVLDQRSSGGRQTWGAAP